MSYSLNNVHEQFAELQAKAAYYEAKVEKLEDEIRYRDGMKALENQTKRAVSDE